jgi:transcriptional regulator with XRE-family HTH domain
MTHPNTTPGNKVHEGYNIKRFREILGIKQDVLATIMGDDWNQQKISLLEQKEVVDDAIMKQVAEALKVPVEAIKNFDEQAAIYYIQNNYEGSNLNHSPNYQYNYQPVFNPIEKWIEALDENKKLYERMLKEKDEMIDTLKALLEKK